MPVGGHTAVTCSATNAIDRPTLAARAETGHGQEGHLHRIEGPSAGQNALLVRTPGDALWMRKYWLCHRYEAVRLRATGRSHVSDPSETTFSWSLPDQQRGAALCR